GLSSVGFLTVRFEPDADRRGPPGHQQFPVNSSPCFRPCWAITSSATGFVRGLGQPSGGRMTQNRTPLFGPTCLGAQTWAPPSGATTLLILRAPRRRRTLEPSLRRPADGPRKGCWFLYGPVPREHRLRTEVRDQSGRSAQLPWSMARLSIPSRLSVISRSHAGGGGRPSSAFSFQKYRRRTRRRVRASIRFSKRAPSSDSPLARPIPPKDVRHVPISHLRATQAVSSPPP